MNVCLTNLKICVFWPQSTFFGTLIRGSGSYLIRVLSCLIVRSKLLKTTDIVVLSVRQPETTTKRKRPAFSSPLRSRAGPTFSPSGRCLRYPIMLLMLMEKGSLSWRRTITLRREGGSAHGGFQKAWNYLKLLRGRSAEGAPIGRMEQ